MEGGKGVSLISIYLQTHSANLCSVPVMNKALCQVLRGGEEDRYKDELSVVLALKDFVLYWTGQPYV